MGNQAQTLQCSKSHPLFITNPTARTLFADNYIFHGIPVDSETP